jgi:PIN domain nuclease of toxin-antitoxin system
MSSGWAAARWTWSPSPWTCERGDGHAAADRLLARAVQVAGDCGLRCLVSYRAIALLAHFTRERQAYGNSLGDEACAATSAILDRLQATGTA